MCAAYCGLCPSVVLAVGLLVCKCVPLLCALRIAYCVLCPTAVLAVGLLVCNCVLLLCALRPADFVLLRCFGGWRCCALCAELPNACCVLLRCSVYGLLAVHCPLHALLRARCVLHTVLCIVFHSRIFAVWNACFSLTCAPHFR